MRFGFRQINGLAAGGALLNGYNVDQRNHNFVCSCLGKAENALDHVFFYGLNVAFSGGHLQHGQDLLAQGKRILNLLPETVRQQTGNQGKHNEYGEKYIKCQTEHKNQTRSYYVGTLLENTFGYNFTEDPDQRCHKDDGKPAMLFPKQLDHKGGDDGRVADHRNIGSDQRGGQKPLGFFEHIQGQLCSAGTFGGFVTQFDLIRAHHANFRAREKALDDKKYKN